ncbi:MAG: ATP-binding protein [Acidobacteriaceae bacterium]
MYSKIGSRRPHSAAWRISLWATLAFALGASLAFAALDQFVANDIQRRSDAWLSGEVQVLGDVAERTPKDRLYRRVLSEVAELASKEVPNRTGNERVENDAVFFLQAEQTGPAKLWVGAGNGKANLAAIRAHHAAPDVPFHVSVKGFAIPFRVVASQIDDGSFIYLGLSERDELRVLRSLRVRFLSVAVMIILLEFGLVFYSTRRMLGHVREITEVASRIGDSDLSQRVPVTYRKDEIGDLALTLNRMLDRIESSVRQLHTMTDSLAHDLRSPLTAIRGKLEMSLSEKSSGRGGLMWVPIVVSVLEELDRLTEFLNASLDVAEARADALRLRRSEVDFDDVMRVLIDLYAPWMSERGLQVQLRSSGMLRVFADAALLHRAIANLLDNEVKHVPAGCTITICLQADNGAAKLVLEDDGPGFDEDVLREIFACRVKGKTSTGHGLGLAFVEAVMRSHGGEASACNRMDGGARLTITLPLAPVATVTSTGAIATATLEPIRK